MIHFYCKRMKVPGLFGHFNILLLSSILFVLGCDKIETSTSSAKIYMRIVGMNDGYGKYSYSYDDNNEALPSGFSEGEWYECSPGRYSYTFKFISNDPGPYTIPGGPSSVLHNNTIQGVYNLKAGPEDQYYTFYYSDYYDGFYFNNNYIGPGYYVYTNTLLGYNQNNGFDNFKKGAVGAPFRLKREGKRFTDLQGNGETYIRFAINAKNPKDSAWAVNNITTFANLFTIEETPIGGRSNDWPYKKDVILGEYYGPLEAPNAYIGWPGLGNPGTTNAFDYYEIHTLRAESGKKKYYTLTFPGDSYKIKIDSTYQ